MEKNYLSYLRNRAEIVSGGNIDGLIGKVIKCSLEKVETIRDVKETLHHSYSLMNEGYKDFASDLEIIALKNKLYYAIINDEDFEGKIVISGRLKKFFDLTIELQKQIDDINFILLDNDASYIRGITKITEILGTYLGDCASINFNEPQRLSVEDYFFGTLIELNVIFSEYIDCFVDLNNVNNGLYNVFFVIKYVCNNMKDKKQAILISSRLKSDYSKVRGSDDKLSKKDVLYMKYLAMKADEYLSEDKILVEEFMVLDERIKKGYKLKGFELSDLVVNIILVTLKEANIRLANYCCIKNKGFFEEINSEETVDSVCDYYSMLCDFLISFLERMKKEYYDLCLSGKDKLALEKISYIDQVVMYQNDFKKELDGGFNIETVISNFDRIGDSFSRVRKPKKD